MWEKIAAGVKADTSIPTATAATTSTLSKGTWDTSNYVDTFDNDVAVNKYYQYYAEIKSSIATGKIFIALDSNVPGGRVASVPSTAYAQLTSNVTYSQTGDGVTDTQATFTFNNPFGPTSGSSVKGAVLYYVAVGDLAGTPVSLGTVTSYHDDISNPRTQNNDHGVVTAYKYYIDVSRPGASSFADYFSGNNTLAIWIVTKDDSGAYVNLHDTGLTVERTGSGGSYSYAFVSTTSKSMGPLRGRPPILFTDTPNTIGEQHLLFWRDRLRPGGAMRQSGLSRCMEEKSRWLEEGRDDAPQCWCE